MTRKPIFDALRKLLGRQLDRTDVAVMDAACDAAGLPKEAEAPKPARRRVGAAGIALMHKWEGCARKLPDGRYKAYPDPGSADGKPWTIGWGSTGLGIGPDTIWAQQQCDDRFENDIIAYADEVSSAIGDAPTTQNQFDALVSFHYNTGAIGKATLTKRHKAGDHDGAAREFARWVNNDGKPMQGLRNRRAGEAAPYRRADA